MKRFILVLTAILALACASAAAQQVTDSGYRTVAYIKSDGTIQDGGYRTIGHAKGIPVKWAAYYFFFMN